MNGKVYRVYRSSLEGMRNTPDDWEKVLDAFSAIWTPESNEDIQKCIQRLEDYMDVKRANKAGGG